MLNASIEAKQIDAQARQQCIHAVRRSGISESFTRLRDAVIIEFQDKRSPPTSQTQRLFNGQPPEAGTWFTNARRGFRER